jgi:hypothetical protein
MAHSNSSYIQPAELPTYIHTMSGVTDPELAARFISEAERIVDVYVGPAQKFYTELTGSLELEVTSGSVAWRHPMFGDRREDYWAKGGTYIEIQGSDQASLVGQSRKVVNSADNLVRLVSGFSVDAPVGTEFTFRQCSRFPRIQDRDSRGDPRMPDDLKPAVAYQVEYGILYGSEEFGLGSTGVAIDPDDGVQSRSYGSGYSESRNTARRSGLAVWVAPKARMQLRRLLNVTGRLRT